MVLGQKNSECQCSDKVKQHINPTQAHTALSRGPKLSEVPRTDMLSRDPEKRSPSGDVREEAEQYRSEDEAIRKSVEARAQGFYQCPMLLFSLCLRVLINTVTASI